MVIYVYPGIFVFNWAKKNRHMAWRQIGFRPGIVLPEWKVFAIINPLLELTGDNSIVALCVCTCRLFQVID